MRYLLVFTALLVAATLSGHASPSSYFADQLNADNIERLPPGGLDAIGGVGDWLLTDGKLCAVISGAEHPTYLALHGGALVDFWHCDSANDQWSVAHTQLNMQKDQIPPTRVISAGYGAGIAWVETLGELEGLETRVRYRLSAQEFDKLDIQTTVTRRDAGRRMGLFASLVLHPRSSLTPFTVDSIDGEYTRGFDQPYIDTSDMGSILSAITGADTQVLLGSRHIKPSISYSVQQQEALQRDNDGNETPVHSFMISGETFSMFGAFTQAFPGFWPRTPGVASLALGQLFDLDTGESLVFRQTLQASKVADAASLLESAYTGATISGRTDTTEAGIIVRNTAGTDLNFARPDSQGHFSARLPEGTREGTITLRTPWGDSSYPFSIDGEDKNVGELASGAPGILGLPRGEAMSLLFLDESEQERIVFHDELAGGSVEGKRKLSGPESYRLSLAGIASDPVEVELPAGSYQVLASRGPEFTVTQARVELLAGERAELPIDPPVRAVATPGLLGADFHVHSGASFDSSLPPEQRVRDFAAQGGELIVASEHNITYDLNRIIEAMALQDRISSLPGVELTGMARSAVAPTTIGHSNVFPVTPDPQAFMGGTLPFEGKRLGQVIGDYKAAFPDSIFQLNHPRAAAYDDDISLFNHLSIGQAFDASKPLETPPNNVLLERHADSNYRDIDFDAMEILNGESMTLYAAVREDWFALLKQNLYKVVTANSDSHASSQLVAYPRSYLVVAEDDPAEVTPAAVVDALRAGALYGSTGPIMRVDLGGAGPGETHHGGGELAVSIDCAPWVEVDEVRIWLNGDPWRTLPATCGEKVTVPVEVDSDSFLFVEAWGTAGEVYRLIAPGFTPFAFANPLFLDVGGDGWRYPADSI